MIGYADLIYGPVSEEPNVQCTAVEQMIQEADDDQEQTTEIASGWTQGG